MRCATWHTNGLRVRAIEVCWRYGPPPEARQRGEHQGLLPFRSRRKIDSPVWSAKRDTRHPMGCRPR
ncbi:conserved hypothetical protein [Sphingomonas aurantiaca]|uniref:Uncharacterized protein n=1 Tax=Sphingomonas aurantiaca TaxID=185949 RepID=A0A5E8AJS7_9SPHN|nr:conserved hypothetical protein [Sphingomonas aurantiaca]